MYRTVCPLCPTYAHCLYRDMLDVLYRENKQRRPSLTISPHCRMHFDFCQMSCLGSLALAGHVAWMGGMKIFSERRNI